MTDGLSFRRIALSVTDVCSLGSTLLPSLSRDSTPGPVDTQYLRRWTPQPSSQAQELSSIRVSRYPTRSSRSDLSVLRVDTATRQTSVAPEPRPATPASAGSVTPAHNSDHVPSPEPEDDHEAQPRIPRPPNAFMLFRSHCIKTIRAKAAKEKQKAGEKRQQVFSRVAGEAWHMLPPDEREEWTRKATDAMHAHSARYPNYKFAPAPRGSSKKGKGAAGDGAGYTVEDIRAKYLNMPGAAVKTASNRKRNSRKNHTVASASPAPNTLTSPSTSHVASPAPNRYPTYTFPSAPQPSYTHQQQILLESPYGSPHNGSPNPYPEYGRDQPTYGRELFSGTPHMDPSIPPYFPNPSFGHFVDQPQPLPQHLRAPMEHPLPLLPGALLTQRRPSTSLGFISHRTSGPTGSPVLPPSERPASASASRSQRPGLVLEPVATYAMVRLIFPALNTFLLLYSRICVSLPPVLSSSPWPPMPW